MIVHHLAAGNPDLDLPSRPVLLALAPVVAGVVGLICWALIDLVRAPSVRHLPKPAWAAVIVFFSAPLGALAYLIWGRDRHGSGGTVTGPAVPVAPAAPAVPRVPSPAGNSDTDHKEPVVRTLGLTRDYGGAGLFDVDLVVPAGSVYGLVGPNGAGKTTLLSILTGLRRADRGTVTITVPRARIAVCPDVPEFDGWLTAHEVVDLARSMVGHDEGADAVERALATCGLLDAAHRRVAGFSRGMTQRLGLACALVGDPQLLLLDEPTSALDPAGRAEVLDLVASLRGRCTVIFSSHILADVQRVADQVGILREGHLLHQGGTTALIDGHLRPSWALRLADGVETVTERLRSQPWVVRVEATGPATLRVDASSVAAGERGIAGVVAACEARMVSCEPLEADLESAFLALTADPAAPGAPGAAPQIGAAR